MDGIVAIVAIGCGTGMVWMFFETIKAGFGARNKKADAELLSEVKALREEVKQLRQLNNDVILNLDHAATRTERRLDYLEGRAHLPSSQPEEQQLIGRGR